MRERAQQREEDLNMIKKLINEGVRAEVLSALEPICRRQEELEDKHKFLQNELNDMSEEIEKLKTGGIKVQTKGVHNPKKVEDEVSGLGFDDEKGSNRDIIAAARRTVGIHKQGSRNLESVESRILDNLPSVRQMRLDRRPSLQTELSQLCIC